MNRMKHTVLLMMLFIALLSTTAGATEITVDPTTQFTFCAENFTEEEHDDGIFLTSVPSSNIAHLCLGDRVLKAGDALDRTALSQIYLATSCVTQQDVSIEYCTISNGAVSENKTLHLSIIPSKNEAPIAQNSTFETYKNISQKGDLKAHDPDNDILNFELVDGPKRGTVELLEDGAFIYTPDKNKVGKDSFSYTVTDPAGNTSEPAKVTIIIKRPTDKSTYSDMKNDVDEFEAMWLKDEGLFTGTTISGNLCFNPNQTVSRGEFLVMVMKLVQADADYTQTSSGFADENTTPEWLNPYLAAALRNGMVSGISTDEGVIFEPTSTMTKAEAAVMLQNILNLPTTDAQAVFSSEQESIIPVWADSAVGALAQAGISMDIVSEVDPMTRRDVANVLYHIDLIMKNGTLETFYWTK